MHLNFKEGIMERTYKKFPLFPKEVSICDSRINSIICSDNAIRFVFPKGFTIISDGKSEKSSTGSIELLECDADEFICHIFKREASPFGARLYGEPVSLRELSELLNDEGNEIEVFLELYDFNYLYWRGVLLPYKEHGLSDNVVIEFNGQIQANYLWK